MVYPGIWRGAGRRTEIQMNRKTVLFKQFYKMLHTSKEYVRNNQKIPAAVKNLKI